MTTIKRIHVDTKLSTPTEAKLARAYALCMRIRLLARGIMRGTR